MQPLLSDDTEHDELSSNFQASSPLTKCIQLRKKFVYACLAVITITFIAWTCISNEKHSSDASNSAFKGRRTVNSHVTKDVDMESEYAYSHLLFVSDAQQLDIYQFSRQGTLSPIDMNNQQQRLITSPQKLLKHPHLNVIYVLYDDTHITSVTYSKNNQSVTYSGVAFDLSNYETSFGNTNEFDSHNNPNHVTQESSIPVDASSQQSQELVGIGNNKIVTFDVSPEGDYMIILAENSQIFVFGLHEKNGEISKLLAISQDIHLFSLNDHSSGIDSADVVPLKHVLWLSNHKLIGINGNNRVFAMEVRNQKIEIFPDTYRLSSHGMSSMPLTPSKMVYDSKSHYIYVIYENSNRIASVYSKIEGSASDALSVRQEISIDSCQSISDIRLLGSHLAITCQNARSGKAVLFDTRLQDGKLTTLTEFMINGERPGSVDVMRNVDVSEVTLVVGCMDSIQWYLIDEFDGWMKSIHFYTNNQVASLVVV